MLFKGLIQKRKREQDQKIIRPQPLKVPTTPNFKGRLDTSMPLNIDEEELEFEMRQFNTHRSRLYQDKKLRKGPSIVMEEVNRKKLVEEDLESIHYSQDNADEQGISTEKMVIDSPLKGKKLRLNVKGKRQEVEVENILEASLNQLS